MRVLITGGAGLLGKGLRETCPPEHSILSLHLHPLEDIRPLVGDVLVDVCDRDAVLRLFETYEFDVVIHAAGLSNVDYVERHPDEAIWSNVSGTENLVEACNFFRKRLIYISTNAVFNGTRAPYREGDVVGPVNEYGRIKVQCERLVEQKSKFYSIARPILMYGWNYPSRRLNPVTWLLDKLGRGQAVSMVTDVCENPLFYLQAGEALWSLTARPDVRLVHLAGGEIVNRYELALSVARVFGFDASLIKPVDSSCFKGLAPRPPDTSFTTDVIERELKVVPIRLEEGLRMMAAHRISRNV